ncbi:MAG: FAD-binding oxidoreductase [Burkholderiaceae bacterium]
MREREGSGPQTHPLGLSKTTSNLFRDRVAGRKHKLDLSAFGSVLDVDASARCVNVEGMVTYETLVDATLAKRCMPAVVPQLKTITVGGALAGVGIEATSFKHGLVHHGAREYDVLLPHGEIVTCRPDNEHRDLFFGFPNSYGTLGYALRVVLDALPIKPYVQVEHLRYSDPRRFFAALAKSCASDADFVDGVVFASDSFVLNVARFVDDVPKVSDYTFKNIYYRSLLDTPIDYLTTFGYLWRWDTDWFWCSRNFGAQNPLVRRLLGRQRLNSRTYSGWMRWNSRWGLTRRLGEWRGVHQESVIQDVDIPLDNAGAFLDFFVREVGISPVWICPLKAPSDAGAYPLYPVKPDTLYINFGFWDVVERPTPLAPGHFNRLVEKEVITLGGIKSLYSDSYFPPDEFAQIYDASTYGALKSKYDPKGRAQGLYEKCVGRA